MDNKYPPIAAVTGFSGDFGIAIHAMRNWTTP
jgi:hypothetical protein